MKKTTSPYIIVRRSRIHSRGIFAKKDIRKGTHVIEYVGEKVLKPEGEKRGDLHWDRAQKVDEHGAVYLFDLNRKYDIDGSVQYNTARLINHSCEPNCETDIIDGHVWVIALRTIRKGEEISYNYGYSLEDFQDHACECGAKNCIGHILAKDLWPRFFKMKKNGKINARRNS